MDGQGKKILVAEDYANNRNLLALLLEQEQYEVHLVADGYEALERMFKEGVPIGLTPKHTTGGWQGGHTVPPNPPHYGVIQSQLERHKGRKALDYEPVGPVPMMNDGSRVYLSRPLRIVGAKWPHWTGNEMIIPPITS